MTPVPIRHAAGFLFGLSVLLAPALAYLHENAAPRPSAMHDFAQPPHLSDDRRLRIVAFGSSSTRGYGASREDATYPAQLQAMLDAGLSSGPRAVVFNRGINGDDIEGMLERIDDDILPRRPALVLWQLGSNDALRNLTPATLQGRIRSGIARLRAGGTAVVLIGPQWNPDPGRRARFAAMNEAVWAAGRDAVVPVVDRYALMENWVSTGRLRADELIGPDGLHLTDRGYALMARAVFEAICAQVPSIRARLPDAEPAG